MSGINMFLKPKSLYKCLFQTTYNSLHKIALAVHLVPNAQSIIFSGPVEHWNALEEQLTVQKLQDKSQTELWVTVVVGRRVRDQPTTRLTFVTCDCWQLRCCFVKPC